MNHKILIENLPDFTSAKQIFLDLETRNNTVVTFINKQGKEQLVLDKKDSGLYAFPVERNGKVYKDDIAGFAFTVDNHSTCYYIPLRHRSGINCSLDLARRWLTDHLTSITEWINHNLTRFDAPFMAMEGIKFTCALMDTLTLNKVHFTERLGHDRKPL